MISLGTPYWVPHTMGLALDLSGIPRWSCWAPCIGYPTLVSSGHPTLSTRLWFCEASQVGSSGSSPAWRTDRTDGFSRAPQTTEELNPWQTPSEKNTDATQQRDEHRARPARTPIPAPTHGAGALLAAARGRRDRGTDRERTARGKEGDGGGRDLRRLCGAPAPAGPGTARSRAGAGGARGGCGRVSALGPALPDGVPRWRQFCAYCRVCPGEGLGTLFIYCGLRCC